jgi:hypothetical protein
MIVTYLANVRLQSALNGKIRSDEAAHGNAPARQILFLLEFENKQFEN